MCKKSESIVNLAVAITKFNGEVHSIAKDAKNPHFKNNYASLDNIVEEIRPILQKHGLSVLQIPGGDGENVIMKTMLLHESGEWLESEPLVMRPVKNDPQGMGSCITYARRYSLCSMLSLSTGIDDDGNAASQPTQPAQKPQYSVPQGTTHTPQPQTPKEPTNGNSNAISDKQLSLLLGEMKRSKIEPEAVKAKFMFQSSKEIMKSQFNEILIWVQAGGDPLPEADLPF